MRNLLLATLAAAGLFCTGIGVATAAPPPDRVMMQDRPPYGHPGPRVDPRVERTGYEWHHEHYRHRRWEHNHWRYWN